MAKNLKDHVDELKAIKHHINPKELEIGEEYHVPPFITINRMDILITAREGSAIKFKIISDPSEKDEKKMEESSILSRFVVKKMKF